MKAILLIAFALLGLVSAQRFFTSTEFHRISPQKNDYFFCVPLGVVPTGEYNLVAQFQMEKAAPIGLKFNSPSPNEFIMTQSLAIHTLELKSNAGVALSVFNEENFKNHGCVSAILNSQEKPVKVIIAFMPQDNNEVKTLESAPSCQLWLTETTQTICELPKKIPMVAIISLSAGVVLLICAFVSCCCMCARRRCKQQQWCKSQSVCAYEGNSNASEMNVVTEQAPAVQDTTVQAPQPVAAAFYYVPAEAVHNGQYTPMQVAPSSSNYPGNVQFYAMTPQ